MQPEKPPQCRGFRLGSVLVDAIVGRRSARHRAAAGRAWPASRAAADAPAFELVLDLADAAGPSTLPLALQGPRTWTKYVAPLWVSTLFKWKPLGTIWDRIGKAVSGK